MTTGRINQVAIVQDTAFTRRRAAGDCTGY